MGNTLAFFRCLDCRVSAYVKEYEDPSSSSGCCTNCGSANWALYETTLTKKKVFELKLAGKPIVNHLYVQEVHDMRIA